MKIEPENNHTSTDSNNLALWEKVSNTDADYKKPFTAGSGAELTTVNVTYLIHEATKHFGPIGIKWGFREIGEPKIQNGIWFSHVQFWYEKSLLSTEEGIAEITQWGGASISRMGDDAGKSAITDGLKKCMQYLGFMADVCMNKETREDDDKYLGKQPSPSNNHAPSKQQGQPRQQAQQGMQQSQPQQAQQNNQSFPQPTSLAPYSGSPEVAAFVGTLPQLDGILYSPLVDRGVEYVIAVGNEQATRAKKEMLKGIGFQWKNGVGWWITPPSMVAQQQMH